MKKILLLMLISSVLWGCKKEKSGTVSYTLRYSSAASKSMSGKFSQHKNPLEGDSLYTQFGDYITSLTPTRYLGNIEMIRFYPETSSALPTALTLINNANLLPEDPLRWVDFSDNATISVIPSYMGDNNEGVPVDNLKFVILEFTVNNFNQEVVLPSQYTNVNLSQFNCSWNNHVYTSDSVKTGNTLYVDYFPILANLFKLDSTGILNRFYFGRTTSTALCFYPTAQSVPELAPAFPTAVGPQGFLLWSNQYTEWTLNVPPEGTVTTVNTTIFIDTYNMIQVYAGADNIPYTSDDVITYAPKYWDRIKVSVVLN